MREPEVLTALQARLGVTFRDISRLEQALRHRSAMLDEPLQSNERLEFLGDSIVGMVVCEYLIRRFPDTREGDLAKAKAYIVSEPTLAEAGQKMGLNVAVEMSPAEEVSGGRSRKSILSDAFEAVIAAVYQDQGFRQARRVVRTFLKEPMRRVAHEEYHRDFKSLLQEKTQAIDRRTPHYRTIAETGMDHDKTFVAQALLGTKVIGEGTGKSKKEAEQAAAQAALEKMG